MLPSDLRRLVILAEGEFAPHSAKTAYGVIRYGRDEVVAVIDSTRAGQSVDCLHPGLRHPHRREPGRGAGVGEPARRTADRDRADRRPAARVVADGHPVGHRGRPRDPVRAPRVPRRRSGVRRRGVGGRGRDRRLPAPAGARGDRGRAPPRPGQAGRADGRQRLRDRQDVGRARAASSGPCRRRSGELRADRPDRA